MFLCLFDKQEVLTGGRAPNVGLLQMSAISGSSIPSQARIYIPVVWKISFRYFVVVPWLWYKIPLHILSKNPLFLIASAWGPTSFRSSFHVCECGVHVCAHVFMHTCVCGGLRLISGVFLSPSLPDSLRPVPANKSSWVPCSRHPPRLSLGADGIYTHVLQVRSLFPCLDGKSFMHWAISPSWALDLHAGVEKKKQGPRTESSFWCQWGFLIVQQPIIHEHPVLEGLRGAGSSYIVLSLLGFSQDGNQMELESGGRSWYSHRGALLTVCFPMVFSAWSLTEPREGPAHTGLSFINCSLRNRSTGLSTALFYGSIFSTGVPSSWMCTIDIKWGRFQI